MQFKIQVLPAYHMQLLVLNKIKCFVLQNEAESCYIVIPRFIAIKFIGNDFYFVTSKENKKSFLFFLDCFNNWFRNLKKPLVKKLILKGLGLKASINNFNLELKLGYSHPITISLTNLKIKITLRKNILFCESVNAVKLGTFISNIRHLRVPNVYKGKGIWYKNENLKLKQIKKT